MKQKKYNKSYKCNHKTIFTVVFISFILGLLLASIFFFPFFNPSQINDENDQGCQDVITRSGFKVPDLWNVTITGKVIKDGITDEVTIAEDTAAHDGEPRDIGLDLINNPVPPTPVHLDLWLDDNLNSPLNQLSQDCRNGSDSSNEKVFNLSIRYTNNSNPRSTQITITWNPQSFLSSTFRYDAVFLENESMILTDMKQQQSYTFTTQAGKINQFQIRCMIQTESQAPKIVSIDPLDSSTQVTITKTKISFTIEDPQGDLMNFSVETVPNIGSDNQFEVNNGSYFVDINELAYSKMYTWYLNVTDGIHWTNETFIFQTEDALSKKEVSLLSPSAIIVLSMLIIFIGIIALRKQ